MARFDDGTLGFHRTGDNASSLLVPYVVDLLQLVWVDPWFEGLFVLSFFVTISDLAIFNFFLLLYDVASKVSPTWLTPVPLLFAQVAVT